MWFRYLRISLLNVLMSLLALVLLLAYVIPHTLPAVAYQLIGWVIAFLVALAFSYWAFSKKIPERKDAIVLTAFHVFSFLLIYCAYGFVFSDHGVGVIFTIDFVVQLALEILAIFLVAYQLRRTKLRSMLGEGRML